jgi:hypothetical protein
MEAERYVSHVIGPKTVTVTSETTPTDTINRADGICVANARFIRPFDLGEHTFFEKHPNVNRLAQPRGRFIHFKTTKRSQRQPNPRRAGSSFLAWAGIHAADPNRHP